MTLPRIGVVGCGWWATEHHIPSLVAYEGAELVALADPNPHKLEAAGSHFGVKRLFTSVDELYGSGEVDGVVIAVPHAFHFELAADALAAGLHVLVEKPMVLRAREAWDLVHTARNADLHLMVGYTFHFTDAARRCREIVAGGELGDLLLVTGCFASMVDSFFRGRPEPYRGVFDFPLTTPEERTYSDPSIAGGGQGQTQVTHAIGAVCHVTDRRIAEVAAFMEKRDLAVDLVNAVAFRFEGGALGTMSATGSLVPHQPQQQDVRYHGTNGVLIQDLVGGRVDAYFNDGREEHVETPKGQKYPAGAPARALADLIAGKGENPASGVVGARAVEFLEAAYRSAETGRRVAIAELEGAELGE